MRIWQRSATAWIGVASPPAGTASPTRSLNSSVGAAAKRCGSAPSTWKFKSTMPPPSPIPDSRRPLLQAGEEEADLVPHLPPARQPSPARADQADQPVALVDAHAVALAR